MKSTRILVIDTATRRACVAAVEGERVLAVRYHETPSTHAERLFAMADEVLAEAGWGLAQLELLVVGRGPGSFTGVRVGMAAAKGLALTLGKPMVGVVSLDAMAWAAAKQRAACCYAALLDAKKGEVFVALYDQDGRCVVEPGHLARSTIGAFLQEQAQRHAPLVLVGEVVSEMDAGAFEKVDGQGCDLPGPEAVAALGLRAWQEHAQDGCDWVEPLYVRPPDAKLPANSPLQPVVL